MTTIICLVVIGGAAGFLSGLLGIGGGLIVVPGLTYLFLKNGIPHHSIMQVAVGSSLATMMFTTQSGLRQHLRKGADIWGIYKRFAPGIVLGTVVGVNASCNNCSARDFVKFLMTHFIRNKLVALMLKEL